ncbi:MAG: ribonuclease PH [Actinomycetota bacterium]
MFRTDGRHPDELRAISVTRGYLDNAEGSVLYEAGKTRVLVAASLETKVPEFLRGSGRGWVTAEYAMLPRSTAVRTPREVNRGRPSGRTQEIQRMIGRSLRAVCNLSLMPDQTVWIDCDVLQADGGTRTASISAAYLALADACARALSDGRLKAWPLKEEVAPVSVGIVGGEAYLDLSYAEDSAAEVDMNIVMTGSGRFVELQGTAEGVPFSAEDLDGLLDLGRKGIEEIVELQRNVLEKDGTAHQR